jgi:hypothetical protein
MQRWCPLAGRRKYSAFGALESAQKPRPRLHCVARHPAAGWLLPRQPVRYRKPGMECSRSRGTSRRRALYISHSACLAGHSPPRPSERASAGRLLVVVIVVPNVSGTTRRSSLARARVSSAARPGGDEPGRVLVGWLGVAECRRPTVMGRARIRRYAVGGSWWFVCGSHRSGHYGASASRRRCGKRRPVADERTVPRQLEVGVVCPISNRSVCDGERLCLGGMRVPWLRPSRAGLRAQRRGTMGTRAGAMAHEPGGGPDDRGD